VDEALASGVTTMLGGGTGPATGTFATTCTPGPWHIERMLQAADGLPMNLGFMGKGNASRPEALREQIHAGAIRLKPPGDRATGLLNEHPGFELPSLENLCLWFANRLKPEWPGLSRITVSRPTIHERCVLTL